MLKQFFKYITQRHRLPLVGILCLFVTYISAQAYMKSNMGYSAVYQVVENYTSQIADTTPKQQQRKGAPMLIKIENSEKLFKRESIDYQILTGNVVFLHDGAYLYCDSAYYDETKNEFEAFSNVKMVQGDTIFLYGDYMRYEGNKKLVKVRYDVTLENVPQNVQLYTDSLDYDRARNIGYYFHGGRLVDTLNVLNSVWGQYEPNKKQAMFIESVELMNPNFTLYSDTLLYNTGNKIADIKSKSVIESDSGTIYTSKGWYNTDTQESLLLDQSKVVNKEGNQILIGDSIFYNRAQGYGEVFGNMNLIDTTKKVILRGNYGYYNEITNYAMASDSAYAVEYSQGDSLFIHADTLKLIAIPRTAELIISDKDSISSDSLTERIVKETDTTKIKTEYDREIKAYYGVRFYRSDMQGVCDSMQFNSKDSILHLFRDPVIWNETNQISGDTIDVHFNDSTIERVHVKRYSFSVEQKDSLVFNQIKGRSLQAFFEKGKVRRILVEGNAESIFHPEEKDKSLIGLNWLEGSYLEIWMKDGEFEKLKTWPTPKGRMTPMDKIKPEQRRLTDFYWYDYLRPVDKDDIFREVSKKATDIRPARSASFDREE